MDIKMEETERKKIIQNIESGEFYKVDYPGGAPAYYDEENNKYYNRGGQELRDAEEYKNDHESHFDW